MHCNTKNNFALSIKSDVLHYHYTRMKRQLQYSCLCAKNNHTLFRPLTPRSRAHFTSFLASSHSLLLSSLGPYHPRRYALALVSASASRIQHVASHVLCISGLHVYITCMLCILLPLPYMLPYCTCTLLISCFVAPCTYFISYVTLYSVPVQRTSRQSQLCRGLATSAQHPLLAILLCTCSTTLSYRIRE